MKIAILGFGQQGRSSYSYYRKKYPKSEITICDQNSQIKNAPKDALFKLGNSYLNNLNQFDLLIRTPFLHPDKIIKTNNIDVLEKITSASNEFLKMVRKPVIGVTGTKGKGTTCFLIEAILKQAGIETVLMGNIGISPLDVLDESNQAEVVIFEIASFQTMDLKYSPKIGACLNMTPEHLDWHTNYKEYLEAKGQLFANQSNNDLAIYAYNDKDSYQVIKETKANIISYSSSDTKADIFINDNKIYLFNELIGHSSDIKLSGQHNYQNVCAAIACCYKFLPANKISSIIKMALSETINLKYRLEKIATINNITYINDSYATTPQATIAALKTITAPIILIVGGSSKKVPMTELIQQMLKSNLKAVILIGETGLEIQQALDTVQPTFIINNNCQNMSEIIKQANTYSKSGDTILLSPASASFGMFNNATDRGKQFEEQVLKLI